MKTLQKRILQEFTPQVQRLMDIYARDWKLHLSIEQADDAAAYMRRLAVHRTFEKIDAKAKQIKKTAGAPHSLAARLYDHDLIGEMTYLQGMGSILRREPRLPINDVEANRFMRKHTSFRLFGLAMGYLASDHNPDYLSFFPPSQLDTLLSSASQKSRTIYTAVSYDLSNVEYVALHQIVKNAPAHYELYVKTENSFSQYLIQDLGGGIRHKDKTPLTAAELPEIFNEFSTKGSGHGLQIARHLIHSLGGHIEVITTTEKGTLRYSTLYEKAASSASSGVFGTLFLVYVPKDYLTTLTSLRSAAPQTSPNPGIAAPPPERELVS